MRRFVGWLRSLSVRQAGATGMVGVLTAAAVGAVLAGRPDWALVPLVVIGALSFAASLQLRRRLERYTSHLRADTGRIRRELTEAGRTWRAGREEVEIGHRRLLAAVENQRLATDDGRREMLDALDRHRRAEARQQWRLVGELEAVTQLYRDFRPRAPMPASGGFALNPTGLLQVLQLIRQRGPRFVLELGSGTSSVWLGYALEAAGGRLVTVDHDPRFADRTRSLLDLHGLGRVGQVRLAPLLPLELDGQKYTWYDPECLTDLRDVDLLVVDGPPEGTGTDARYPAMPVLERVLSPAATIVLDDATRPAEAEVVRRWLDEWPGLSQQPGLYDRQAVLSYQRA